MVFFGFGVSGFEAFGFSGRCSFRLEVTWVFRLLRNIGECMFGV